MHEAARVAGEIHFLSQARGAPWSDFCILFRGNHQSRALEKALQLLRVPYHLSGGTAFLDRGEVKDALSWLRLIANPEDDAAFLRAVQSPARGVGATSLAKLAEIAQHAHLPLSRAAESIGLLKQLPPRAANALSGFADIVRGLRSDASRLPPAELVRKLNERSGLLAALRAQCKTEQLFKIRRGNLDELADWFDGARGGAGPGELAASLALLTHADQNEAGNQMPLMSPHAAKRLEFRSVFIVGVTAGTLPPATSLDDRTAERRVGTRQVSTGSSRLTQDHKKN